MRRWRSRGAAEIRELEAECACALEGEREDGGEGDDGGDVEDALPRIGRPDDEQDEGVGEREFEDGARASELWLKSHVWMDGGVREWVANCSTRLMRDEAAHEWGAQSSLGG